MSAHVETAFRQHERLLWGLCYRMTGSAADAEDLVQDTFARVMQKPPKRVDDDLKPWLVKVALNLSRDHLRKRKHRDYKGPWLPSPVDVSARIASDDDTASSRYDQLESVSFAFLLSLEALTPTQRAVLILRDVCDYSVRETAHALELSEPNVKTTLHRARKATEDYDGSRQAPTAQLQERTRDALQRFLFALTTQDLAQVEALLADDVRAYSDGGGEFFAALKPVIGVRKVATFFTKLSRREAKGHFEIRMLNGLPALVSEYDEALPNLASRIVLRCEIDDSGKIARIYSVLATPKLSHVSPLDGRS